jgi:hypothetical protein
MNGRAQVLNKRTRRLVFFVITAAILVLIQTPVPILLLANLVSVDEAARLTFTLRAATPGLLVALAVTYLYERSKDIAYMRSSKELSDHVTSAVLEAIEHDESNRLERLVDSSPPAALVEAGLQRLYGNETRLDNLVDTLLPTRGLLRDVDVSFILRDDGNDPSMFTLDIYYRAMAFDLPEFVVAYVEGSDTASELFAHCPRLTNAFSFDSGSGAESAAARALADAEAFRFMVEERNGGKFSSIINGPLQLVPQSEHVLYDVPLAGPRGEKIILLRRDIPNSDGRNVVYMTRSSGTSETVTRFVYYFEDRPAYVRKVSFDWSGLSVAGEPGAQRHIVPFFVPRGAPPIVDEGARRVDVVIEQWILPGGGALLAW